MEKTVEDQRGASDSHSWSRAGIILLLIVISLLAIGAGLRIRHAAWFLTQGGHFQGDISNAYFWGQESQVTGLFYLYDKDSAGEIETQGRDIDYPPLRLAIVEAWWHWTHLRYPRATQWFDDYQFNRPLLQLNTLAELETSILIFFLIRLWRIRLDDASRAKGQSAMPFRGVGPGMVGALLFWFNPAIIWVGHCWPQWDSWPIPFFVGAVLLASLDWWAAAGICLAIGASLKGQLLLGAPVILFWAIFRLQFGFALRLVAGFLLTTSAIALPWMHPSAAAWRWGVAVLVAVACLSPFIFRWKMRWELLAGFAALGFLLIWPWEARGVSIGIRFIPVGLLALLALSYLMPVGLKMAMGALVIAILILLMMTLFGASSAWYTQGFVYGTRKFHYMVTGTGAFNLPKILKFYWHWPMRTVDPVRLPLLHVQVTFTRFSRIIYGICLVFCGLGAAIHDRRRDPRFLVSMTAPWLLFFMILTQMHSRYSIWAAGLSALLAGVSVRMALLGVMVSIISLIGIVQNQMVFAPDWSPNALAILNRLDPSLGWLLVLAAVIYLYVAVVPRMKFRSS